MAVFSLEQIDEIKRLARQATRGDIPLIRDDGTDLFRTGILNIKGATISKDGAVISVETVQEVDWQAVIQLDDTATGNNKGRWKVSLPDDAGTVTVFAFRAVNGLDANTNVSADMVFDVNLNGASQGTVTIPSGSASGDADVADFTLADGDRITIDKDSGPDEGSVHQVVLIGKRQLKVSIAS